MNRLHMRWFSLLFFLGLALVPFPVAAQQQPTISTMGWYAGPDAVGDSTISGSVDLQPGRAVSGWVVDSTAQGWSGIDDVQLFDGLMGAGGQMVGHPQFQLNRPDVASALNNPFFASSGWTAPVPSNAYGPVALFYVYAHTPSKGWWYQQVYLNTPMISLQAAPKLDVEVPTPLATVHNNAPYTMRGSAYDPAASASQGTGIDRVQVYLNGDRQSGVWVGDATLGQFDQFAAKASPQFANAGWSLQFQPDSWQNTIIDNTITPMTIYAHSSVTGQEAKTQVSITITIP
jgi:hypothetical protein